MHWAALSGNPEVCKLLLNERTDINSINIHKETPLLVFCVVCLSLLDFLRLELLFSRSVIFNSSLFLYADILLPEKATIPVYSKSIFARFDQFPRLRSLQMMVNIQ